MNKYVSPIIEIELVEVESILDITNPSYEAGENELPVVPVIPGLGGGGSSDGGDTGGGSSELPVIPNSLNQYFNV
jgi:hypothetical protein